MMDSLRALDRQVFLKINGLGDSAWDYLFAWPTVLGEAWAALLLAFIFMIIWDQKERFFYRYSLVVMSALVSGVWVRILKNLFQRPRPYHALYDFMIKGELKVNCIFKMDISNSFPSGHSATVFAAAVILNYIYGKRLWFLYPIAVWIACSRIYVGAHFPADVLTGSLIGILSSLTIIFVIERWNLKPGGISWLKKV